MARVMPAYLGFLIFGYSYMLVILHDTLAQKNTIQIIGLCIYSVTLTIYATLQVFSFEEAVETLQYEEALSSTVGVPMEILIILIASLSGFSTILLFFIAWKIYGEFSWVIFQNLNASVQLQRLYVTHQVGDLLLQYFCYSGHWAQTSPAGVHIHPEIRRLFLSGIHD